MAAMERASLPPSLVLFLGVEDAEWGQQLVALVGSSDQSLIEHFAALTSSWLSAERPRRWILCPELTRTAVGKWERKRWVNWLRLDRSN